MQSRTELRKLLCLFLLVLADGAACLASFLTAFVIRDLVLRGALRLPLRPVSLSDQVVSGLVLLTAVVIVLTFAFEKLYIRRYSFWEEARHLFRGLSLAFVLVFLVVLLPRAFPLYPRATLLSAWASCLVLFPVGRLAMKRVFKKTGLWKKRVLVMGTNPKARGVARALLDNTTLGYEIAGFLTEDKRRALDRPVDGTRVFGHVDDLNRDLCRSLAVQDIVIALSGLPESEVIRIAKACEPLAETVKIVPDLSSVYALGVELENVGDVLAVTVTRNLAKPWNLFAKNAYEALFAFLLLLLLLPLFLVIAAAVRIDSPGPVIYSQARLGKKGRVFRILKFRSMYANAQERLEKYLRTSSRARGEWRRYRKLRNHDPRVTRVGKWIRKWSLDELPQLLNVLKGEMSLVGPRPYLLEELRKIGEPHKIILSVTPGMTGLWQIRGRNELSFRERSFLDDYYIRNWSLWLDLIIMVNTIKVLSRGQGAY